MADLDAQVRESQEQVEQAQARIAELTSRIETARSKIKGGEDATLDIENAISAAIPGNATMPHEGLRLSALLKILHIISRARATALLKIHCFREIAIYGSIAQETQIISPFDLPVARLATSFATTKTISYDHFDATRGVA